MSDQRQEIERLQAQIKDLVAENTQLKAAHTSCMQRTDECQRQLRAATIKNHELELQIKTWEGYFFYLPILRKKLDLCQCGCGEPLIQPKTGRKQHFANSTHRSRYHRMKKKQKILRRKKSATEATQDSKP